MTTNSYLQIGDRRYGVHVLQAEPNEMGIKGWTIPDLILALDELQSVGYTDVTCDETRLFVWNRE